MFGNVELLDLDSFKRDQYGEFQSNFTSQFNQNNQEKITNEGISSTYNQPNLYREILDEAQKEIIIIKQKLLEKEEKFEKLQRELQFKTSNEDSKENSKNLQNSENIIIKMKQEINSLEANRENLKKEISLLQLKENELQNNVTEINKATKNKDQNIANISNSYEEKLKVQQDNILQLESQLNELRNHKEINGSKKEIQIKVNELSVDAGKSQLQNIQKTKEEIITLNPKLNSENLLIQMSNEENNSLLQKLELKDEEISKYLKQIESSSDIIKSLEEKIRNLIENNQDLKSGVYNNQSIENNEEVKNKSVPDNIQIINSVYIEKLTTENNCLKNDLENMGKKYLECQQLLEKKDSTILNINNKSDIPKERQNNVSLPQSFLNNPIKTNQDIYGGNRLVKQSPNQEYQNMINPYSKIEIIERQSNFPVIKNKIIAKKETNTPILKKPIISSYGIVQNRKGLGGKIGNQNQDELFTESWESNPVFLDYQVQKPSNKREILNTIIKNKTNPSQNQNIKNSYSYIPNAIPEIANRSLKKNYEQKSNFMKSEIIEGINRFITPSPLKITRPLELLNRSPAKEPIGQTQHPANITGITASKIHSKNFYGRHKNY